MHLKKVHFTVLGGQMNRYLNSAVATGLLLSAAALPAAALAEDTTQTSGTAAQTSVKTTQQVTPSLLENARVTYTLDYYGASVGRPSSGYQPDRQTGADDLTTHVFVRHGLGLGYALGGTTLGVTGTFDNSFNNRARPFTLQDPYLTASNGSIFKSGNYTFGGEIRAYLGASDASQKANMIVNFRTYQFNKLVLPETPVTLKLTTYFRPYVYSKYVDPTTRGLQIYAGPEVDYQVTPTLTAWLLFEYYGQSFPGRGAFNFSTQFTDLEPGISWDITPSLSFTPYLDIQTSSNRVATDTTTMNANITWKAL